MHLLVVNSNTSDSVTDLVRREAQAAARPGTRITALTAPFGSSAIQGPSDVTVAAAATRDAIASYQEQFDGVIIACFSDPGLSAVRRHLTCPVIGIAEAAMATAAETGNRFAILTVAPTTVPEIERLAFDYGMRDRLTGVHALPRGVLQSHAEPERTAHDLAELAQVVMTLEQPDIIVLGGAIMAGIASTVSSAIPIPVLDGLNCAIRRIEQLIEPDGGRHDVRAHTNSARKI